jgi:hypothetical protein
MMQQPPWYRRSLRDDWHMLVFYLALVATVIISVLHFFGTWGEEIAKIAPIIILVFVAVIATRLENRFESVLIKFGTMSEPVGTKLDKFDARLEAVDDKFDAKIEAVDNKFDAKLEAVERNLIPLANVRFYDSQDETFRRLAAMTWRAKSVVKATRFSPGDITQSTGDYWQEIKEKACDPNVRSIRIHSLAHPGKGPVENLSKLVEQLKDAQNFQLGIAFFENEFELIIADDQECIVCFHQPWEIIGNGLHFDSTLPKGKDIVERFVRTFDDMRGRCHVLVDFDKWVSTPDDIKKLQAFINRAHDQCLNGTEPEHYGDDPKFLRDEVFGKQPNSLRQ